MNKLNTKLLILGVLIVASVFCFFPVKAKAAVPSVSFSYSYYSVMENKGPIGISVKLSATSSQTVKVSYKTIGGTATPNVDYYPVSGTLIFNPGQVKKTFYITIINDSLVEPSETVGLSLYNLVNATLGNPSSATLAIVDDDAQSPKVFFSSSTYSVNENAGQAQITVKLSATTSSTVSVKYITSNGTAIAGKDYVAASGTLIFNAGQSSKTFNVYILDDSIYEGNETVNLTLSNPVNANLGSPSTSVLTIIDNESPPVVPNVYFSPSTYSVNENYGTLELWVNLSASSATRITVNYNTVNGTALAGSDYYATSGVLTFSPGQTAKMFFVSIIDDSIYEPTEYFYATLSSPVNATLGSPSNAKVNIIDNDPVVPSVYFSSSTYSVNEKGGSTTIQVLISAVPATPATSSMVSYSTNGGGTATGGGSCATTTDYITKTGDLNWAIGDSSPKTFTVTICDDFIYEGNETVGLFLYNPINVTLGSPNSSVLTIIDNDSKIGLKIRLEDLKDQLASISAKIYEITRLIELIR